jgi:hypothetical protein
MSAHEDNDPGSSSAALDKRLSMALRVGGPIAVATLSVMAGASQGASAAVLVLASGALVGVVAMFWASLRTLLGETRLGAADAFALAAPQSEEEQKRALLRALKDLEFDREVGKISDEDFVALTTKYRSEAKALLRTLEADAAPRRKAVEDLVAKRLARETPSPAEGDAHVDEDAHDESPAPRAESRRDAAHAKRRKRSRSRESVAIRCVACDAENDEDAVFCKKCGVRRDGAHAVAEEKA